MSPLEYAITQIGQKEKPLGSNCIKYNTWYYGEKVSGYDYPWCAVFIGYCFYETGYYKLVSDVPYIPSVESWAKWAKSTNKRKSAKTSPKKGWLACFSWAKSKSTYDHIGFVVSDLDDDSIRTVEGNTNDGVYGRTRSKDDVICYIAFDIPDTAKKKSVTVIAKEVIDGKWGNGSERKTLLQNAGYSYNKVQKKVNELLKAGYK